MKPIRIATLTVGDSAPDFSGIAVGAEFADGKPFQLSNYFDEQIVLYFYPQDHTPGFTARRAGFVTNGQSSETGPVFSVSARIRLRVIARLSNSIRCRSR